MSEVLLVASILLGAPIIIIIGNMLFKRAHEANFHDYLRETKQKSSIFSNEKIKVFCIKKGNFPPVETNKIVEEVKYDFCGEKQISLIGYHILSPDEEIGYWAIGEKNE